MSPKFSSLSLWLALVFTVGCGSNAAPPASSTGYVCTNSLTGQCEPCPGVSVCVDPVACVPKPCDGGDVLFGGDASGTDAGAVDSGLGDSGLGDSGAVDSGGGDSGLGDSGAADSSAVDTGSGDGQASTCVSNQRRCGANGAPELCLNGAWIVLAPCGSGLTCDAGQCVCAKECSAIGQVECTTGVAAVKTCELVDGCLKWGVPKACQPGFACQGGQCKSQCNPACPNGQVCQNNTCVPAQVGTLSCGQVVACVNQFAQTPNDKVNIDACIAKGTADAQKQYVARKACIALSCQKLIDAGKVSEAMLCVYTNCGAEQTACLGAGQQNCEQLGSCLSGCGTSGTCVSSCHTSSTVEAVKSWYTLSVCGEQYCANLTGQSYGNCVTSKCVGPYQVCFGSSSGGGGTGLNCAQVLQCAGKCTDKPCAEACKSQASAQGAADLNALLTCNGTFCAGPCGTGTQQQCDACLMLNCGKELQSCS